MKSKITIINYGVGNLLSVSKAFEKLGAIVEVSNEIEKIVNADRLVLPGVGAFPNAMEEIQNLNLIEAIKEYRIKERPLLGICLGMQLLMDESREFKRTKGLGLIPGKVVEIPKNNSADKFLKVPHVGWAELIKMQNKSIGYSKLLENIGLYSYMYFVHSYMSVPENREHLLASYNYDGNEIPAIVGIDNVFGCQFHPEKSGKDGLKILSAFLNI